MQASREKFLGHLTFTAINGSVSFTSLYGILNITFVMSNPCLLLLPSLVSSILIRKVSSLSEAGNGLTRERTLAECLETEFPGDVLERRILREAGY